jgi:pyruvate/2-oxoglutarate dehydrogenase complex dihydrolipoamide acyltransferase (E2) component
VLQLPQDAFLDKHGVKLGFMSAFVKASADALQVLTSTRSGDSTGTRTLC